MLTRDDVEYELYEEVDKKSKDDTIDGFNGCCPSRCQLHGRFSQSFTGDDGEEEEGEEDVDDDKDDNMVVVVVAVFHRRHGASYLECPHRGPRCLVHLLSLSSFDSPVNLVLRLRNKHPL